MLSKCNPVSIYPPPPPPDYTQRRNRPHLREVSLPKSVRCEPNTEAVLQLGSCDSVSPKAMSINSLGVNTGATGPVVETVCVAVLANRQARQKSSEVIS